MSAQLQHYVRCAFCGRYDLVPDDGSEVPLGWFFVARGRKALAEEQHQAVVVGLGGRETVTVTTAIDRWLFCSEDCLAHVAEIGTTPAGSVSETEGSG